MTYRDSQINAELSNATVQRHDHAFVEGKCRCGLVIHIHDCQSFGCRRPHPVPTVDNYLEESAGWRSPDPLSISTREVSASRMPTDTD